MRHVHKINFSSEQSQCELNCSKFLVVSDTFLVESSSEVHFMQYFNI